MQLDRFTVSRNKITFVEVSSTSAKFHISGYPLYLTAMGEHLQPALEWLESSHLQKIGPHFVNPERLSVTERNSTRTTLFFDGCRGTLEIPNAQYDESPVPTSDQSKRKK